DRGGNWAVGVDGVAGGDEEIRARCVHCLVATHAADFLIDTPALPGGVPGPPEGLRGRRRPAASAPVFRTAVPRRIRRRSECPPDCLAEAVLVLEVKFKGEAGSSRKSFGMDLGGEVAGFGSERALDGAAESVASPQDFASVIHCLQPGAQSARARGA